MSDLPVEEKELPGCIQISTGVTPGRFKGRSGCSVVSP